jgi:hypothetical protein
MPPPTSSIKRAPIAAPALALALLAVSAPRASAHDDPADAATPPLGAGVASKLTAGSAGSDGAPPERASLRWHGSVVSFDQSMTTQTVGLGGDYQSADPTYEWWVAFKPRFYLFERKRDAVSLNLWMNLYLELTNSDTTTRQRELLLGPTYFWATYGRILRERGAYRTSATVGPRVTIPTDRAARDSGQIVGLGAVGAVSQTLRLAGKDARAMKGARLGLGAIYNHPWDRATTPVNGSLQRLREDVAGRAVISDQLSGEMNVKHALSVSLAGDLQVWRRLSVSLSYVWIGSWLYSSPDVPLALPTGDVLPSTIGDPTAFRVRTWLTASVSYDVTDELAVALGYYNLANQLGPDGTRRSPLWSPDARVFLTVTSNLDAVYQRLTGKRPE